MILLLPLIIIMKINHKIKNIKIQIKNHYNKKDLDKIIIITIILDHSHNKIIFVLDILKINNNHLIEADLHHHIIILHLNNIHLIHNKECLIEEIKDHNNHLQCIILHHHNNIHLIKILQCIILHLNNNIHLIHNKECLIEEIKDHNNHLQENHNIIIIT